MSEDDLSLYFINILIQNWEGTPIEFPFLIWAAAEAENEEKKQTKTPSFQILYKV